MLRQCGAERGMERMDLTSRNSIRGDMDWPVGRAVECVAGFRLVGLDRVGIGGD